jgi:hypothetical protein
MIKLLVKMYFRRKIKATLYNLSWQEEGAKRGVLSSFSQQGVNIRVPIKYAAQSIRFI